MQPVSTRIVPSNCPVDREGVLQELYIRRPEESPIISLMSNLIWRGRVLIGSDLLCKARKDFPNCIELKILFAHLALIQGKVNLAYLALEEALTVDPKHKGLRLYWGYVCSLNELFPFIPPKEKSLAEIESVFADDPDVKAALRYLILLDKNASGELSERAKISDCPWLRYIYLSAISRRETYEVKKPFFEKFAQEKLVYPPLLASSVLMQMLEHKDYQTLKTWFSNNPTLAMDFPAIGVVKVLLEILEHNEVGAQITRDRLIEQLPDIDITSALFIGSERCEIIFGTIINEVAACSMPGLKLLADLLYDLRNFELAEKCYKICSTRFPDDWFIWMRLAHSASYGFAEDEELEAYFAKALALSKQKKEQAEIFIAMGLIAFRRRDFKGAVLLLEKATPSPANFCHLGYAHLRLENTDAASKNLSLSLMLDPKNPRIHYFLGLVKLLEKNLVAAKQYLFQAIQLNSVFNDAHVELARIAFAEKNYDLANRHLNFALIYGYDNDANWDLKGRSRLAQDNIEEAHYCFMNQYRLAPHSHQAGINYATTCLKKGLSKNAYELVKDLPDSSLPHYQSQLNLLIEALQKMLPTQQVYDAVHGYLAQNVVHPDLPPLKGRLNLWKTTEAKNYAEAFAIVMQQTPDIEKMEGQLTKRRLLWLRCNHEPESKATKNILDNPLKASLTIPEKAVPELVYNKDVWDKELEIFKAAREKHVYEAALMALYTLSKLNQIKKKDRDRRFTPFHSCKSPTNLTLADLEKIKL